MTTYAELAEALSVSLSTLRVAIEDSGHSYTRGADEAPTEAVRAAERKIRGWASPAHFESRICFALAWFDDETDALAYEADVRRRGRRHNGGWYDGAPCGREPGFDQRDEDGKVKLWAVST